MPGMQLPPGMQMPPPGAAPSDYLAGAMQQQQPHPLYGHLQMPGQLPGQMMPGMQPPASLGVSHHHPLADNPAEQKPGGGAAATQQQQHLQQQQQQQQQQQGTSPTAAQAAAQVRGTSARAILMPVPCSGLLQLAVMQPTRRSVHTEHRRLLQQTRML